MSIGTIILIILIIALLGGFSGIGGGPFYGTGYYGGGGLGLEIGRGVFLISAFLIITFMGGWRMTSRWSSGRKARERLLLVGTGPQAIALARELFDRRIRGGADLSDAYRQLTAPLAAAMLVTWVPWPISSVGPFWLFARSASIWSRASRSAGATCSRTWLLMSRTSARNTSSFESK